MTMHEYSNVGGNYFDKYNTRNFVARHLMQKFLAAFDGLVDRAQPKTAFEVGCGEGHLSLRLLERGIDTYGVDLDSDVVAQANAKSCERGYGRKFEERSVYELQAGEIRSDIIICCEVLEHLPDPEAALGILSMQDCGSLILSVPREPIWRILNVARGKYLREFGNTPGHIQHWGSVEFMKQVSRHFHVAACLRPLPWTMILAQPKT